MRKAIMVIFLMVAGPAAVGQPVSPKVVEQAESLRDAAMEGSDAFAIVESLTTEVGPRLAGTEREARARDWAVAKLTALGFEEVRVEPFTMTTWVRGEETARIAAPYPQPLVITALGNSGATDAHGFTGEVVAFDTIGQVEALPDGALDGKIAYVSHRMGKTQDGSSYAYFGKVRFQGPSIAASKGAAAMLIRSVGTSDHRFAHTGGTRFADGVAPIPAAALSSPDADQLERVVARAKEAGEPVKISMTLTPKVVGETESANIIVDIKGSERPEEIIIVGGHLDSWDLGTGAVDDGAGVAITTAAMKMIRDRGWQPKRTLRLVLWGAEEVGLLGARAYAERHAANLDKHITGSESDFGAERIWQIHTGRISSQGREAIETVAEILAPIGVALGGETARSGGPDLSPLNRRGMPVVRLRQDGRDYFDLHHTPDDTLNKIDPAKLDQNVAAYAAFLWVLGNSEARFRPDEPRDASR